MRNTNIAFIGGGNMARSLVGGLIADGCDPENIAVSDPSQSQLDILRRQFPIRTCADNEAAISGAHVVVLAVKPQVMRTALVGLANVVSAGRPLLLSIAAGIRTRDLGRWLGGDVAVVRAMPNTPAMVQSGATALFANQLVDAAQRELAESIMRAVGLTVWLDKEELMDAVTALSGSGPAYFFLVMEAMEKAGIRLGLEASAARLLTLQTALGAARLALESAESTATLRAQVTSPGGTTEKAIGVLCDAGLEALIDRAVSAAHARSGELAVALGEKE